MVLSFTHSIHVANDVAREVKIENFHNIYLVSIRGLAHCIWR